MPEDFRRLSTPCSDVCTYRSLTVFSAVLMKIHEMY